MTNISDIPTILENSTGRVLFARVLEPRFMLDGAAAVTVVEGAATPAPEASAEGSGPQSETQALVDSLAPAEDNSENAGNESREIAFVDSGVENYQALIDGLPNGVEVIVLDSGADGIAQISAALAGRTGIEAIHILSHGNDGTAVLGNAVLSNDTIDSYASQISSWGDALSDSADILFYGCNIAGGSSGEALVAELAQLSGADIAASTDITASAENGGNWVLEHNTGVIEAANTITATSMAAFGGQLLTIDLYDFNSVVNTTGGATTTTDNDAASIFGTEREITITDNGGGNSIFTVNPGGAFAGNSSFTNGVGADSTVEILYDGVGTGGFAATDFTHDGTSTGVHDRFLFNVRLADFPSRLDIEVTTSAGVSTSSNNVVPAAGFGNTPFAVLYSSFAGANFTSVTALKMTFITTSSATDLIIDFVATSDTTTIPPGPLPQPDPPGTNPPPTTTPPPTDDPPPTSTPPTNDNPVLNFEQQNPVGGDSESGFPPLDPHRLSDPIPDYGTIGLHVGHAVNSRDASIHAQYDGNTTDVKSGIGSGAGFSLQNAVTGNQDANVNDAAFGTGGFGDSANPAVPGAGQQSSGDIGAALSNLTPGAGSGSSGPGSDSGEMLNPAQESFFLNVGDSFVPLQGNENGALTPVFAFGDGQIQPQTGSASGDIASLQGNNAPNAGGSSTGPASLGDINAAFDSLVPSSGASTGPVERFSLGPNGQIDRLPGNANGGDGLFGAIDPIERPERELLNPEEEEYYLGLGNGQERRVGEENQPPGPNERFFLFEDGNIEGQPSDSGQQWSPPENNLERDVDGNPQPKIGDGQLTSLETGIDLQGVPGLTAQLDTVAHEFDDRRDNLLASLVPVDVGLMGAVKQAA